MALTDPGLRPGRPATTTEVRSGPATDPLAWLTTAPAGEERWFWEVPDDDMSWVGLGATDVVSLDGPSRFDDAARRAAELLNDLDVEAPTDAPLPRLAAGFAFDDRRTFGSLFALDLESFFQRFFFLFHDFWRCNIGKGRIIACMQRRSSQLDALWQLDI